AGRVEPIGGNDVAGKRLAGVRVVDDDRPAAAIDGLGKVAAALGHGGDQNVHRSGLRHKLAVILLANKEEELVLAVDDVRDDDWPAEIPSVKVVAVERAGESLSGAAASVVQIGVG